jgi:hypothetical protein
VNQRPSPLQLELLALAAGGADVARWERLQPQLDLDRPEFGTYWLLPLVCDRLAAAGIDDPALARLRGIRRKTLYVNSVRLERLVRLARAAAEHGIDVVLGPETSALMRAYESVALRPSPYFDLVAPADALAEVARAQEWSVRTTAGETLLEGADGAVVAVRGFAARGLDDLDDAVRSDVLAAAEPVRVHDAELRALSPTDVALGRSLGEPRLLALLDVAMLTSSTPLDTERFVRLAAASHQTLRASAFFAELAAIAPNATVDEVRDALSHSHVDARSRLELRLAHTQHARLGTLPQTLAEHLRRTAAVSPARVVLRLPATLRREWGGLFRPAVRKALRHTLGRQ